jgi:hypothetical protein
MNGLDELADAPGAAADFAEDTPGLEPVFSWAFARSLSARSLAWARLAGAVGRLVRNAGQAGALGAQHEQLPRLTADEEKDGSASSRISHLVRMQDRPDGPESAPTSTLHAAMSTFSGVATVHIRGS